MRPDGCTRECRQSMASVPTQCVVEAAASVRCTQERAKQLHLLGCTLTCMLILYERTMLVARSDADATRSLWSASGARPTPELRAHVAIERRSTSRRISCERRELPMRSEAADLFCGHLLAMGLTHGLQTCFGIATASEGALIAQLCQRRSHPHAQLT